ncbi:hypothetical protein HAX54_023942 [Datura stramonium]|uniref:Uncharacterized protein n=1 Tax=Datura stramonium TaxID=4076 RepID=A0ABS8UZ88_DATST|nr:hypothetical protein [Datura stramonium]
MIDQDEKKEVVLDAQKISTEESDKEVKKGDIDLKTDVDQFVMIDKKHHKEISDDDYVVKQENGIEIHKSEINLLDLKIDDEISTNQIHKIDDKQSIPMIDSDEQKEVVPDAQKISIEESDKEMKKGDRD